jgi:hypothetical protein
LIFRNSSSFLRAFGIARLLVPVGLIGGGFEMTGGFSLILGDFSPLQQATTIQALPARVSLARREFIIFDSV